ncbi:NADH dehydrogenase [ubiquinone] 1 alpha subcomplex subunit 10, mitochondrial [Hyperolius riggenbachi]|uniref:NADH dehydrogenase [ubiquinone] 1 alpha subcomplex subunit 10, mitochondrial n=1 Tax=Hyperolius riggenbachi TaxID=752182 RepID=UPI0035A32E5C
MFAATAVRSLRLTWRCGVISTSQFHVSSRQEIEYGHLAFILGDRATKRFGPNSKIITVDGNLASGKGKVAQELSQRLGMKHFPEVDRHYLDKSLGDNTEYPPELTGHFSLEKFYEDPKCPNGNAYRLQYWMFSMRMIQYADALEHLLSTGQGVVLERSPFSDFVFLEAMFKNGYIRPQCVDHYYEMKNVSIDEFLPPHVAIYLDVPAPVVYKKIQEKENDFEKKVALPYLQSIEDVYKTSFLPNISETTKVLKYAGGDEIKTEQIAEDLEYVKITNGPWLDQDDVSFHYLRMLVQDKYKVYRLFGLSSFIPEVTIGGLTFDKLYHQYRDMPGNRYAKGFNEDVGDKYIWLK